MTCYEKRKIEWRWDKLRHLLPDEDRTPIASALRLAAEQYRKDAATQREAGIERIAEGFARQAEHADQLADIIEP